ncbi:MAG: ABC transporter permease, partial [Bifidobacteriaceae bacterium]|nr:ABC transporter permease [Bifidobacteriaceae bacterium]
MMQRSRRTLVPAGIAIAIGSLFICATLLLGNVLDATSTKSFTTAFGGADYAVSIDDGDDSAQDLADDDTTLLHTLKNTHMDQIGSVQGVGDTRYSHMQYDAVASGSDKRMMEILEVSAHGSIMPVELTQGAWPTKAGEVAIDEAAASALKVSVGSTLTVGGTTAGTAASAT